MAKRIITKIGDVFCVEIDNKYKRYFQYFCSDMTQLNSSVIRVFKKMYPMDYSPILMDIVADEVDFYAHTILRVGIELNAWYKIGKLNKDFSNEVEIPIFGNCNCIKYINNEVIHVNPDLNWQIWKINQNPFNIGLLPEHLKSVVEFGDVIAYIDIVNRIKYGYYKYTLKEYNSLRRIPHSYTDSYTMRRLDNSSIYFHYKGEDATQRIQLNNDNVITEEGNPLPLPKFWETNWKNSEFITAEEFNDTWNKYNNHINISSD